MKTNTIIFLNFDQVQDMLGKNPAYMEEFCRAAIMSFKQFQHEYKTFLTSRDLVNLRKTGHRIKPVAQMLGISQIIEEYEYAKRLLMENTGSKNLQDAVQKMDAICKQVLLQFEEKLAEL